MAAPQPRSGELLLAPLLVGVCATDKELFDGSMVFLRTGRTSYPITPGHEWVARVVAVGKGVTGFAEGDRVVGECSIGCGSCDLCTAGAYHQCPNRDETGILGREGALTELMVFPATSAHVVPDSVDLADAALIEPTAVAYRAITRLDPALEHPVLVVGAGTIGYLVAVLLKNVFGADVAVVDPRADQVGRLEAFGVRVAREGETFASVVEAAGHPSAFAEAMRRLGPGGRLVVVGLSGEPTLPVAIDGLVVSDQAVLGSIGSPHVWPEIIDILARGAIRPSALVSAVLGLDDYAEALQRTDGKILLAPNPA